MTVHTEAGPSARISLLTLRLAAGMFADGGVTTHRSLKRRAEATRSGQRNAVEMVRHAMRPLLDDKVVRRIDEATWYVPNLADLAAWIADAAEARERAGLLDPPPIPAPRAAA